MATIGNLWINIKANTRSLQRGIGGARNSLAAFGKFMMNPAVLGIAVVAIAIVAWVKLGSAIVSGLKSAVMESKKFNQSMAKVGAVTMSTGKGFDDMRQKALELGRTSVFTADQVAEGMLALAKAGLTENEVIKAVTATSDLAAAADLDLAEASGVVVNAMRAFDLKAKDTTHIADVFAIVMSRSNTTVLEMADAMSYVAPVARSLGFSLEHTAAMIGVLADSGIKGSMAGTGLRRVMSALASEIEEHGVQALDNWITAQHTVSEDLLKFGLRGFNITQVLALMRTKMLELGEASLTASNVVKKMAEMRMDTLEGDFVKLNSAISGFKIIVGDEVEPALRQVTQMATHLVNALTSALVEWLQESESLVFSTRELERVVESLIITAGVAIAAMVNFFNESIREARILVNIAQLIGSLWSAIEEVASGDPWGAILDLGDMKTDVLDIKDTIEKGWLGEGGASIDDFFDKFRTKFQENRDRLAEELKVIAEKSGNRFLESLGLSPEGLKKLDEDQLKVLDKMYKFGVKLDDAFKYKGMEKFEIDAEKAIEILQKLGGEESAIATIRANVYDQHLLNNQIAAHEHINSLIKKGDSTYNEGLTTLETFNWQLTQLKANTDLLELSAEDMGFAWDGAMDNLIKKGRQMTESVMTPLEKFAKDKLEIEQMFQLDFINEQTYNRMLEQLKEAIKDPELAIELGVKADLIGKGLVASLDTALGSVKIGQGTDASRAVALAQQTLSVEENMKSLTESIESSVQSTSKSLDGTLTTEVSGLAEKVTSGVNSATIKAEVKTERLAQLQQETINITREYIGDTNNLLDQIKDKMGDGGALT